jgi:hypothetical protein
MTMHVTPLTLAYAPLPGTPDDARERAEQCLRLVALYASHAAELAEVGDDLGVETNMHKLLSAARAAAQAVRTLRGR